MLVTQPHQRPSLQSFSKWTGFPLLSLLSWSYHVPQLVECLLEAGLGVGKPSASGNLPGDSSLQLPHGEAAGWGAGLRWLGPRSSSCSLRAWLGSIAVHPQLNLGLGGTAPEWGQRKAGWGIVGSLNLVADFSRGVRSVMEGTASMCMATGEQIQEQREHLR